MYRELVARDPDNADALHLLGVAAYQRQQPHLAVEYIGRAIKVKSHFAPYYSNLGAACRALGRLDEAVAYFRQAIRMAPGSPDAHFNLGNVYKDQGRYESAVASYNRALQLRPDLPDCHNNLGDALKELGEVEAAIDAHRRAITLKPDLSPAHFNLGNAYRRNGQLDEAAAAYLNSLAIDADQVDALVNLGCTLDDLNQFDEALACLKRAVELDPQCPQARFNLALIQLRMGNFAQGWADYDWRWKANNRPRGFSLPEWDGRTPIGKTVLVYCEQGIGDQVMFASCLPDLLRHTGACLVECDARLAPLFSRSFRGAWVFGRADQNALPCRLISGETHTQVALASLPRFYRPSLESFPKQAAYLQPDSAMVARWQSRFDQLGPGLKVGISWFGGKDANIRRQRSTTLDQWQRVLSIPEIHFVNLQYGQVGEELIAARVRTQRAVHHWTDADPLRNLDGLAAQIAALDLVVSVDNSTVHLAGAVGTPVWALLPCASDWRWLVDRDDSPWCANVRLFRQTSHGDWSGVFQRVEAGLREKATQRSSRSGGGV